MEVFIILFTNDVAHKVIKVDVTPLVRAVINKSNASALVNEVLDVPALTIHCLGALSYLKQRKKRIK